MFCTSQKDTIFARAISQRAINMVKSVNKL